ncbi:MAG: PHB depolymerase family esterase [Bacteroidota bacterium]
MRWYHGLLYIVLLSIGLGCGQALPSSVETEPPPVTGWQESTLPHDGLVRPFRYYLPERDASKVAMPVIFLLHGGTGSADNVLRGGSLEWPLIAEEEQAILILPNGTDPVTGAPSGDELNWNDCRPQDDAPEAATTADDVGFIRQLIGWAEENFSVDTDRVYATGASNGGMMSYRLAQELDDRIAAIAAFVANEPAQSECRRPSRPVPVFIANGTDDPLMPFRGGAIAFGGRGFVLSTGATVAYWTQVHGIGELPLVEQLPDLDRADGSVPTRYRYGAAGPRGAPVEAYRIDGGGHLVPSIAHPVNSRPIQGVSSRSNGDLEGARAAWAFLSRHRLSD